MAEPNKKGGLPSPQKKEKWWYEETEKLKYPTKTIACKNPKNQKPVSDRGID